MNRLECLSWKLNNKSSYSCNILILHRANYYLLLSYAILCSLPYTYNFLLILIPPSNLIVLCEKSLTQLCSNNLLEKSSENGFIFLPAFYLIICLMKAKKIFWNNSHFERKRAGFLLRCQNSLRKITPKMMHEKIKKLTNNVF